MKFNSSILHKSVIASTVVLATASVMAFAQSAPPAPSTGPQAGRPGIERGMHDQHHSGRSHHMHGLFSSQQLAGLKTSLRLTPQQAALWEKAEKAMTPAPDARAKRAELAKAHRAQTLAALADPNFDPRKFADEQEKQRDEMQAQRKARMNTTKEAWFSVYDSLDAAQRGQVREFLRARLEMRGKMRGNDGMRGNHRHGEHRDHKDQHADNHQGTYFQQDLPVGALAKPVVKMS